MERAVGPYSEGKLLLDATVTTEYNFTTSTRRTTTCWLAELFAASFVRDHQWWLRANAVARMYRSDGIGILPAAPKCCVRIPLPNRLIEALFFGQVLLTLRNAIRKLPGHDAYAFDVPGSARAQKPHQ